MEYKKGNTIRVVYYSRSNIIVYEKVTGFLRELAKLWRYYEAERFSSSVDNGRALFYIRI